MWWVVASCASRWQTFGVCDTWLRVKPRPESPARDNWNFIKVLFVWVWVCVCMRVESGCGCFWVHMGVFYMSNIKHGWLVGGMGSPPAATCSSAASYKSCSPQCLQHHRHLGLFKSAHYLELQRFCTKIALPVLHWGDLWGGNLKPKLDA